MGTEIERKYLVRGDAWRAGARGTRLRQGYLSSDPARTVRVRSAGAAAWLTIKGPPAGRVRAEFEYPIPVADATILLDTLCERPLIDKVRHVVVHAGHTWEIDEFQGENAGLVIAEVELDHAEEPVELPPWVGAEVTDDPRYQNANLVRAPYTRWSDQK